MVRVAGFEPTTPPPQTECSSQTELYPVKLCGGLDRSCTCILPICSRLPNYSNHESIGVTTRI